jgi:hypothetical protein
MTHRIVIGIAALLLVASAPGAELFYMDHDPLTREYVGPVGPLVLSGEIVAGDYDRLLSKIAEDENRFMAENKIILAADEGDPSEAIKIATLVKSLYTEVVVGPLTGRCVGACFLIYAAAAQRGTDGQRLLGIYRPEVLESQMTSLPAADAAAAQDAVLAQARAFLQENAVPTELIEEVFRHTAQDVYWLSDADEQRLGARSPSFEQFLTAKCAWNGSLERDVYKGERPMEDLRQVWACRSRVTQSEARQALASALKEKSTGDANSTAPDATHDKTKGAPPPCHTKSSADPKTDGCRKEKLKDKT